MSMLQGDTHRFPDDRSETIFNNSTQSTFQGIFRCPAGLRRKVCRVFSAVRLQVTRGGTLRGVPRLFVLRRAFCLYWALTVALFVYLKWYFPLYLTSTVYRNTLDDFRKDWCRVRRFMTDWERMLAPCRGNSKHNVRLPGWDFQNRTDATQSFVSVMNIKPAGEFSSLSIQSQTFHGEPKTIGGDDWRVFIFGESSLAPTVIDHNNGTYEVLFLILEPGDYSVSIVLDYSLCDGMKNPPEYWFMVGNIHGSNQPPGALREPYYAYLRQPLWEGIPLSFTVSLPSGPMRYEEFLSYGLGGPSSCGMDCRLLWDGFGRWTNKTWKPHLSGLWAENSPRQRRGVLWIYGDSMAGRFYRSIRKSPLCKTVFRGCTFSYNWVYPIKNATVEMLQRNFLPINVTRVVRAIGKVIHLPQMDEKSVIILNHGLHFITSTNFTTYREVVDGIVSLFKETKQSARGELEAKFKGKLIWKTNAAVHRERLRLPHHPKRRFLSRQRVELYNAYATWAMCKAGFQVLDVYPLSASFPNGTDYSMDPYDSVHYKDRVFEPAEKLLLQYFTPLNQVHHTSTPTPRASSKVDRVQF